MPDVDEPMEMQVRPDPERPNLLWAYLGLGACFIAMLILVAVAAPFNRS